MLSPRGVRFVVSGWRLLAMLTLIVIVLKPWMLPVWRQDCIYLMLSPSEIPLFKKRLPHGARQSRVLHNEKISWEAFLASPESELRAFAHGAIETVNWSGCLLLPYLSTGAYKLLTPETQETSTHFLLTVGFEASFNLLLPLCLHSKKSKGTNAYGVYLLPVTMLHGHLNAWTKVPVFSLPPGGICFTFAT